MSLKDELNGLFNDRKMVTRAEQRAMENKVCFLFCFGEGGVRIRIWVWVRGVFFC